MTKNNCCNFDINIFQFLSLKKLGFIQIYVNYSISITKTRIKNLIINLLINDIKIIKFQRNNIIKKDKKKLFIIFAIINISSINFYFSLKIR